jgi:hypothetical protein
MYAHEQFGFEVADFLRRPPEVFYEDSYRWWGENGFC